MGGDIDSGRLRREWEVSRDGEQRRLFQKCGRERIEWPLFASPLESKSFHFSNGPFCQMSSF